jgi:penicillin-insensitive murein endopeptidase
VCAAVAALGLALAVPSAAAGAGARAGGRTARIDGTARVGVAPPGGLSVGSPTDGRLVGGAHLETSPWLRVTPCYEGDDVRWGLEALVSLVEHGARAVRKQFPDSVLSIGHLSRRTGGDVDRHASHESGRDADVGFYITNQQGKPIYAEHFVRFLGDGTAPSWPGARFDDARNWAFVASIVTDPRAHVSYVFVASPLRARLLTYAQKIGAPYATRVRASELMAQPRGALPHDDHFHVRISCPPFMEACVEYPTRSIARAKVPRSRSHGAPPSVPSMRATLTVGAHPAVDPPVVHANTFPPPIREGKDGPAPEISGLSGSSPPLPAPFPPPADTAIEPPALLDAPIDDVDGVVE